MALYNFSWVIPHKLAGSAMPGDGGVASNNYLDVDLMELAEYGVKVLVSLEVTPPGFEEVCRSANLFWVQHVIPDFGVPEDAVEFGNLIDTIVEYIDKDWPVCVHCRAGIGRTGLVVTCVLGRLFSLPGPKALDAVRQNRAAVESVVQIEFVNRFLEQYEM